MPHGGARPGSGPKPKPDAMVKRMYVLRQDQVDWLESLANKGASMSHVVRTALDCYIVSIGPLADELVEQPRGSEPDNR